MKKTLMAIMAVLALGFLGLASATVSSEGPFTVISGQITDANNDFVSNADVLATCNGNEANAKTNIVGMYYISYDTTKCTVGDDVFVQAVKDGAQGSNEGSVEYNGKCRVNTSIVNVQIPEFGVIASAIALLAGIGIVVYRRN